MYRIMYTLWFVLAFSLLSLVAATSWLHRGYASSASTATLRGRTLISARTFNASESRTPRLLQFRAELKRPIILFDQLEENLVRIASCTRNASTLKAAVTLHGHNLNRSHFEQGAAFVIYVFDWERNCAPVEHVPGINPNDDVLFFVIDAVIGSNSLLSLQMTVTSGSEVVPHVDIEVGQQLPFSIALPNKMIFDDDASHEATNLLLHRIIDLVEIDPPEPRMVRRYTFYPVSGVKMDLKVSMLVGVSGFSLHRYANNEFKWKQFLDARLVGSLEATTKAKVRRSGQLLARQPLLYFDGSVALPFVGRAQLEGFGKAEWMLDADIDVGTHAKFECSQEMKHIVKLETTTWGVTARRPRDYETLLLESASVSFVDQSAKKGFSGFFGIRPAVGLSYEDFSKDFETDTGAYVGLQAMTSARQPPFRAYNGLGSTLGNCQVCHKIRGSAAVKTLNASLRLRKGHEAQKEYSLSTPQATERFLGTVCALEDETCGGFAEPCVRCVTDFACPQDYECINRKCFLRREGGQSCGPCAICNTGLCSSGSGICIHSAVHGATGTSLGRLRPPPLRSN